MTARDRAPTFDRPPLLISPARGQVTPLPPWAQCFMDAGSFLATQPQRPPTTFALSLPTRAFAAVFAAVGVVHARRKLTNSAINQFEEVWAMTEEVEVRYRLKGQAHGGIVIGRVERDGRRFLVIKERARSTSNAQVPEAIIDGLVIQRTGAAKRIKSLTISDPWLAQMLEGCEAEQYLFSNRHDCLIVGQNRLLQREAALELQLPGAAPGAPRLSGTLDCVLRVRRWQAASKVFSSDVWPANNDPDDIDSVDLQHLRAFPVAIFDGAGAYLRWRHQLRHQHHLVLLSRTDRRLDEAVGAVDQAFKTRAGERIVVPSPPCGIEELAFRRAQ